MTETAAIFPNRVGSRNQPQALICISPMKFNKFMYGSDYRDNYRREAKRIMTMPSMSSIMKCKYQGKKEIIETLVAMKVSTAPYAVEKHSMSAARNSRKRR